MEPFVISVWPQSYWSIVSAHPSSAASLTQGRVRLSLVYFISFFFKRRECPQDSRRLLSPLFTFWRGGVGGHHIYRTVSLADGCFPSRRFLSLADSSHQRLPRWGTARTAVAGGKAGETAERLMEVNNSKLQKSGCKKRRRAFKVQPKGSLFFSPLTATFGGGRQKKYKNFVILWNGFGDGLDSCCQSYKHRWCWWEYY